MQEVILGIDPGTKEMGMAVIRGQELLGYGVHTLRNGSRPYDLIGQARKVLLSYLEEYAPQVVVIEAPLMLPTKRAALLSAIAQELHERAAELGARVIELTPQEVRRQIVGSPRATKIDVAEALVRQGFGILTPKLPKKPARSAIGLKPGEKYWLHMFDALGLAAAIVRVNWRPAFQRDNRHNHNSLRGSPNA